MSGQACLRRAVFLDKDGTLVENVPYNVDPARVRLLPGVLAGLRMLSRAGFALVVVSNQPGVALGRFPVAALDRLARCLDELMRGAGVSILDYRWCTHHPDGSESAHAIACTCRKPQPGLLLDAAQRHDLDLAESWIIGDILDDVEAGRRAGCRGVLVDGGGETQWRPGPLRVPEAIVPRFDQAAEFVLRAVRPPRERACPAA
jgi:D-glycero-D-manno-heptose 1,7-bisphosphate phosphatase